VLTLPWMKHRWGPIGLDVGARGARAAQLVRDGDAYQIQRIAVVERSLTDEAESREAGEWSTWMRACVHGRGFRGRSVVTCAANDDCDYHFVDLPHAVLNRPPLEAEQAVRFEVSRLLSDPIEDLELRYWPLVSSRAPGPGALAVASRRSLVIDKVSRCHEAGLMCVGVDAHASALSRLGCVLAPVRSKSVWGVLDVGCEQSRLILCVDTVPSLVRVVGSGGRAWTRSIAESLQLSVKAAEIQKREHGIPPVGSRGAAPDAAHDEIARMVFGAIRSELNEVAGEVKRSYEYVLGLHPEREPGALILVGGGASLRGLPEFLSDALGIAACRASAFIGQQSCRLRGDGGTGAKVEVAALALGLAIEE